MFICKSCHEKDINVTKCTETYEDHNVEVWGDCDICGKDSIGTAWCLEYEDCKEILFEGEDI